MAEPTYRLSANDVRLLQRLLDMAKQLDHAKRRPTQDDPNDHQAPETYVARVPASGIPALSHGTLTGTGTGDLVDDTPGSAFCSIFRIQRDRQGTDEIFFHEMSKTRQVFNLSINAITQESNPWILVERVKGGFWFAVVGSPGEGFWARLIDKTPGLFPSYTVRRITDSASPSPITWADAAGRENLVAYEVNGVDLPVAGVPPQFTGTGTGFIPPNDPNEEALVAFVRPGAGDYYLFNQEPRWEHVRRTGDAVDIGGEAYYPGELLRYDQDSKELCVVRSIYIRAASQIPVGSC